MPVLRHCLAVLLCAALLPAGAAFACPPDARPAPALATDLRAASRAQGRPLAILAIGSSSTAGVGASLGFPARLARRLVEAWGQGSVEVVNAGVSGESSPSTLKRLEAFMAHKPAPDLVIWQVGTNDVIFGNSPAGLGASVGRGLDAIAAAGARVIVIDQQYFPGIMDVPKYETFVAAVRDAAAARRAPLLPRYAMMKQWAARDPEGFRGLFSWDRFHMNDAGYACLADLLAFAILAAGGPSAPAPAAAPAPGQARQKPAARPQ